jgi:hypothetical protein
MDTPDVDELNEKIPRLQWEMDLNGELRPPWVMQHVVYLLDIEDGGVFTFCNSTFGARLAVEDLRQRVFFMRELRGEAVLPVVTLGNKLMKTKFGQKLRPHFDVVEWRQRRSPPRAVLPAQTPALPPVKTPAPVEDLFIEETSAAEADLAEAFEKVEKPTLAEEMNDDIPF